MSLLSNAKDAITRIPRKVDSILFWGKAEKFIGDLFNAWNSAFRVFAHPIEMAINSLKGTPPPKPA